MIVVDTNIIAYFVIKGDRTDSAWDVMRKDPMWAAPPLWRSEFRNVLTQYMRCGALSIERALQLAAAAEGFMRGNEYQVSSSRVLELANAFGCTAYDCEFVVLAQDLNAPLVTADRKLQTAFPAYAYSMEAYLAA